MEIGHPTGKCLLAKGNKEVDHKWTIMEGEMDLKAIKIEVLYSFYYTLAVNYSVIESMTYFF